MILQNETIKARLKAIAVDVIARCTFPTETAYGHADLLLPAGDNGYPAFWIRDCAMMMQSGLVPPAVMRQAIETTARYGQNGPCDLHLKNGLVVPAWTVADHINHNGRPVFYPGTGSDGDDQGNGSCGFYPPLDDNGFFITMVGSYLAVTGDSAILDESFGGVPLIDRLVHAWNAMTVDAETGLCVTGDPYYAVDFGFHDTIRKSGLLLPASLIRRMAAETLARLFTARGDTENAGYYASAVRGLDDAIIKTFYDAETGWFYSATGIGHQHDVWGTAVAAYLGLLSGDALRKTAKALYDGYRAGTTVCKGSVRQIPTNEDFSDTTMWECAHTKTDYYQNGCFWPTPAGFYAAVLAEYDPAAAEELLLAFIQHTEKHWAEDAPWEWMDPEETLIGMRIYGTSATGPYAAVQMLIY